MLKIYCLSDEVLLCACELYFENENVKTYTLHPFCKMIVLKALRMGISVFCHHCHPFESVLLIQ